ncbi:DUF2461 domain-containing protein [Shimia sp.]|uniref:DUF2461 domain-containing protein n=1 Tax=Shimia sp. TaxID=1954381 RepID=UPI003B8D6E21
MKQDPCERLIEDTQMFLSKLAENNTREWFVAHKETYEDQLKSPAQVLLDQVGAALHQQTGHVPTSKLFRPNRDVRFSKDKTPYHLHLHMLWLTPPTGWFFGIGLQTVSIGAGIMGFDTDGVSRWRAAVASAQGDAIASEVQSLLDLGARLQEPELKRVPAPFDKEHQHRDLLRRKSLCLWFDRQPESLAQCPLTEEISATFEKLAPLNHLLRGI